MAASEMTGPQYDYDEDYMRSGDGAPSGQDWEEGSGVPSGEYSGEQSGSGPSGQDGEEGSSVPSGSPSGDY